MTRKRRVFGAAFKAKVALAAIANAKSNGDWNKMLASPCGNYR